MNERPQHPIRVVCRRTGLSSHVIRVWERRYGAVVPHRTETNRRLYTEADIRKLQLLRRLIRAGRAIGQIASLSVAELEGLLVADGTAEPVPTAPTSEVLERLDTVDAVLRACLDRVEEMDPRGLEKALDHARVNFTQPVVLESIVLPLMANVGDRWRKGTLKIVNEHMASVVVRNYLGGLLASYGEHPGAPLLTVATPTGQHHEIGALAAAVTARDAGWRVFYLGANLPAEEIAAAARCHQSQVVALSIVHPPGDAVVARELMKLRSLLPPTVPIVVGGHASTSYANTLDEVKAIVVENMLDFRKKLELLQQTLFG